MESARSMQGIRIRGLTKRYPAGDGLVHFVRSALRQASGRLALRGVDLDLEPGRIYALVGPNGAGKTTLLKIMAGLVLPTEGRIELDGKPLSARSAAVRETVGYVVSDERSFQWRLSVAENLRFFATLEHVPDRDARVREVLEHVGLLDRAEAPFRTLSTGMRQRVALARGLIANPRILLMDEATRSLDPLAAEDLRVLLASLFPPDSPRTLVYSTHNLAEVEEFCTDLVVLREGRVVASRRVGAGTEGTALDAGCFTLRTRRPLAASLLDSLDGLTLLRARGNTVSVRVAAAASLDALVDAIHSNGLGLLELRIDPWIEDLLGTPGELAS
ncbi:MAG TPA: ABC transporter ATP-binding protein [Planctomycetes bacterium]|nr:ABC transporter ATP-binding protein [Planctomycetota bacterium]